MAIQVLQREKLDSSGASSAIQNMVRVREMKDQAEQKRAQMKYYSDELALRAKESDNEVEKARLEEKSRRFKVLSDVFGEAVKSGDPQKTLMAHFALFPESWEQVGSEADFQKRINNLQPSGEEQVNQEVAQILHNRRLGNVPGGTPADMPGVTPQRGLVMSNYKTAAGDIIDLDALSQIEAAKQEGQYAGKKSMTGVEAKKALDNFFALDDMIQRGIGMGRFAAGTKTKLSALNQGSVMGGIAAARQGAVLNLRTFIARLKDVGNLNQNEQEAAQQLIPSEWDSEGTKQIRKAYLYDLMDAYNNGDGNRVEDIIKSWMKDKKVKSSKQSKPNMLSTGLTYEVFHE